jgi:hypothetical protein
MKVFGFWFLVFGFWFLVFVLGTWYLVLGACNSRHREVRRIGSQPRTKNKAPSTKTKSLGQRPKACF